ncbi:hypothetical protein V8G54_036446 [Vigna mungo]|uniref:Uncharacterized protein n=1 Tax=Vigna mungo TaxID=3915 RepID=A0AAQ3MH35_VIGMU
MASPNQSSGGNKGKEVVVVKGPDPVGWINDEETRENFLEERAKVVVSPMYLKLSMFEREGFLFPGWLETQELSAFVQMKGDWFPDLVRVVGLKSEGISSHLPNFENNQWLKKKDLYTNWLRFPGRYTIERLFVHEGLNMEEKITAYLLAWVILLGRLIRDKMSTEDVYLLHAIKNNIPTNWVEMIKNHMKNVVFIRSHYLPYAVFISKILVIQGVNVNGEQRCSCNGTNVINRNTIASLGLVKTVKGWCFKGEEDLTYSSGSTPATNEERTNFFLETNFQRFAVEQFKILNDKFNHYGNSRLRIGLLGELVCCFSLLLFD